MESKIIEKSLLYRIIDRIEDNAFDTAWKYQCKICNNKHLFFHPHITENMKIKKTKILTY